MNYVNLKYQILVIFPDLAESYLQRSRNSADSG